MQSTNVTNVLDGLNEEFCRGALQAGIVELILLHVWLASVSSAFWHGYVLQLEPRQLSWERLQEYFLG